MFLWPSLEYPPILLWTEPMPSPEEECQEEEGGVQADCAALWVPVAQQVLHHCCLRAGHRGALLSHPKYLPTPCQMQPKNRRAAFLGYILGHHLCTLTLLLLPMPACCRQSRLLPSSISKHFFLQEESIEVKWLLWWNTSQMSTQSVLHYG